MIRITVFYPPIQKGEFNQGGALKDVLKLNQETNEDLIMADEMSDGSDDGSRLAFGWEINERRYRRLPEKDGKRRD
ncbi:replication protein [Xenorhabdus hominickii]|uniref:Replication protein n=1 Tax=Xenorhabdus hominickii TaxID=351679 RepID=A0A1V0M4T8_XENHO|nr:hypothetical protein [Xenorhabdus hominickii]PHM51440.1 replication protein [Xenorhabdus hominickii]